MDSPLQAILEELAQRVQEGCTGLSLDSLALELIRSKGYEPAFLGYKGFPNTLCVSVNGDVIHGIPDGRPFQRGDVVSLDLGLRMPDGQYDDGALTVGISASSAMRHLIRSTRRALEAGVKAARPGSTTHNIARAIKKVADREGLHVVKGWGGHGIGTELHMPPFVPNEPVGDNARLEPGMRLAIEPMLATKDGRAYIAGNGWTVRLYEGTSAHFERTVAV
jgi:methionyl aminopeptidase